MRQRAFYRAWHGSWWAIQFAPWKLSVGVHVDPRTRHGARGTYGPYVDFHLPAFVVSVGVDPIYAGNLDLQASWSRGGICGDAD